MFKTTVVLFDLLCFLLERSTCFNKGVTSANKCETCDRSFVPRVKLKTCLVNTTCIHGAKAFCNELEKNMCLYEN